MFNRVTVARPTFWNSFVHVLMAAGLGALLYSIWFLADGAVHQRALKAEFVRPAMVEAPSVAAEMISQSDVHEDSRVLGQLKISSVHLDVMVGEGLDKQTLRRAAGHLKSSAKPGEQGNMVLLGHRDTFFRPLRNLREGDVAEIRTSKGVFLYRIDSTSIVNPEDVDVRSATDHPDILLVTCYPFYYVGPSPQRFVAHGRLIEDDSN